MSRAMVRECSLGYGQYSYAQLLSLGFTRILTGLSGLLISSAHLFISLSTHTQLLISYTHTHLLTLIYSSPLIPPPALDPPIGRSCVPPTENYTTLKTPKRPHLPLILRSPKESDWNYIYDSWKRSYREYEPWVDPHHYYSHMSDRIDRARKNRHNSFIIACDKDDPNFIFGWACLGRKDVVVYAFVRQSFRHAKVARRLIQPALSFSLDSMMHAIPIACTHWTRACEKIGRANPGLLLYEPSKNP